MKCPQCGTENPAGMKFCGECGTAITGAAPSALNTAASPTTPTPAPAAAAGQADLRLVTVLFADISGFTSLSEKLHPEAVRDLITACFDRLVPCIQRYGGTIDKFIGDEVMALFGAPTAHENDPERALRAALEMRDALAGFNREHGVGLGLHFGVNTGLVYAGGVGGGHRQDYSVMGDAVNVAARLKGAAKTGDILVGVDTHRQVEHLFDFQAAEALGLKGKAEAVAVCRLLCARAAAPTSQRPSRGLSSPLVGREDDLAAFKERLIRLRAGEGGVLIVTGEAGLGKSRLVAEVRSQAQKEGFSWLEGRTLSFGRTISYWPLLEIIQMDARITPSDPEGERWAKLSGRVTSLFKEETPEVLPYLATLLSLPVPEDLASKVRYLDGEAMGRQVYRATRLYFARLAAERPTVVVFEDVHWLDASSAALLEHVLPLTKEAPILVCLISRPESESALTRLQELAREEYADRLTEIALDPLSPEESATLACNLAHLDVLPVRLRDAIAGKAEGNPFYVEEVVRTLVDQGGLVPDPASGRYRVTENAANIPIPDTLQGVIMARFDRLDEDLKAVLRLASVVGRTFFYRVLASVAQAERELDRSLADLEARELIREKVRRPELEYIFKHALVQEATYESILLQRRKELHRKVASAIETLFSERLDEFYSLLAYHYSKAEDWEKAQEYLFKAGDQAGSIAADAEALAHYEEAVEAYTRVFGEKWDRFERAALERKMGEALARLGEQERGRDYIYRALATLGSPFPVSSGDLRRAILFEILRQVGHRLLWWFPRRAPSGEACRVGEERLWLYVVLGTHMDAGRPTHQLLDVLLALNVGEGIRRAVVGADAWVGSMMGFTGFACDFVPLPRISGYYHRRGLALAEQSSGQELWLTQTSIAGAQFHMGIYEYVSRGDWANAHVHFVSASETFLRFGPIRFWALVDAALTLLDVDQGRLEECEVHTREVITRCEETADHVGEAYGRMDAGLVLLARGELEASEAHLRAAGEHLASAADESNGITARSRLARCLLKQGRVDEAHALFADERRRCKEHGVRGFPARSLWLGCAELELLRAEEAQGSARVAALVQAKDACRTVLRHGKLDIGALVPAYRMQGTYEWLRGHPEKAQKLWQKSLDHAVKPGARYEEALTRLEIGRRLGDRTALETAEAAFAEMGAAFDLAEARRLLGRADRDGSV